MKKTVLAVFVIAISVTAVFAWMKHKATDPRAELQDSPYTKVEYRYESEGRYKAAWGSDPGAFFDSLRLDKSGEPFEGEWVYRFTFFCNEVCRDYDEIIVLVGENSVLIDQTDYVFPDEVDHLQFLDVVSAKYESYEYAGETAENAA